jgi:hypothetical protein
VSEVLTAFLSVALPFNEEVDEVFQRLDGKLGGIGQMIGWDASPEELRLHVLADEPERAIALLAETLRELPVQPPTKLVARDPDSGAPLYERSLT